MSALSNVNVKSFMKLITPMEIFGKVSISKSSCETVLRGRNTICNILKHDDKRKIVIVGPCSIHDPKAALEYAKRLCELSAKVQDRLFLVMRTYFEKPRTIMGWKGFINDPFLDNTLNIGEGLLRSRQLLSKITNLGLPVAMEALDPIVPQYLSDLISWTAIGARTTESQTHREMASGLSSPVGFKNNTDGNINVAINALKSALHKHCFLGIDQDGHTTIVETKGNINCHLILRGGINGPNYDSASIAIATAALKKANLNIAIMVDCSHDNSHKDYKLQSVVLDDCVSQIMNGNGAIVGFMLESNLYEGSQTVSDNLKYGVSITDGCISFETTEMLIMKAHEKLRRT